MRNSIDSFREKLISSSVQYRVPLRVHTVLASCHAESFRTETQARDSSDVLRQRDRMCEDIELRRRRLRPVTESEACAKLPFEQAGEKVQIFLGVRQHLNHGIANFRKLNIAS